MRTTLLVAMMSMLLTMGVSSTVLAVDDATGDNYVPDVDIASAFNVPIEDCFGAEITGDLGSLIVNNFGMVNVTISTQGIFTLYCANVKDDGIITLNSEGVV